jgi:hypothetical protein
MNRLSDGIEKLKAKVTQAVMTYNRINPSTEMTRELVEQFFSSNKTNPSTFDFADDPSKKKTLIEPFHGQNEDVEDIILNSEPFKKRFEDEYLSSLLCRRFL